MSGAAIFDDTRRMPGEAPLRHPGRSRPIRSGTGAHRHCPRNAGGCRVLRFGASAPAPGWIDRETLLAAGEGFDAEPRAAP